MDQDDEKTSDTRINVMNEIQQKCQSLRKQYELLISDTKNDNTDAINKDIKKFESKLAALKIQINEINIDESKINLNLGILVNDKEKPNSIAKLLSSISQSKINDIKWKLTICGRSKKISNNGALFSTTQDCLARTNQAMVPNSGIYKIRWRIENDPNQNNIIGICTNYYKNGSNESVAWLQTNNYIGWSGRLMKGDVVNDLGLTCGYRKMDTNIFAQSCTGNVGDESEKLPGYKKNDIIGLVYDSDKNTLRFELNGKMLPQVLESVPKTTLYWCVGKWNVEVKYSILN